jgi:hypothetical protein
MNITPESFTDFVLNNWKWLLLAILLSIPGGIENYRKYKYFDRVRRLPKRRKKARKKPRKKHKTPLKRR